MWKQNHPTKATSISLYWSSELYLNKTEGFFFIRVQYDYNLHTEIHLQTIFDYSSIITIKRAIILAHCCWWVESCDGI